MNQVLPAGTVDPIRFRNAAGAVSMYRGALLKAHNGFLNYVYQTAMFTDEVQSSVIWNVTGFAGTTPELLDARHFTNVDGLYRSLQAIRTASDQAIALLTLFADETPAAFRGELYALKGFTTLMLAEFFCSGVPLSTVDFDRDFTYVPGSSSDELFAKAIQWFDSAESIGKDSIRIVQLAQVGAARALLQRGEYEKALERVNDIPVGFVYGMPVTWLKESFVTVGDNDGGNGLAFRTSRDPRSAVQFVQLMSGTKDSLFAPAKYFAPEVKPQLILGSYVEAALIQAEVALRQGNSAWLSSLNALRTDGSFTVSASGDTLWNAGTGGVAGLPPLQDPADRPIPLGKTEFDVRVDLLFAERAFWLFSDGHRQGDLRRLVRQYQRDEGSVYPSGPYGKNGDVLNVRFGTDVAIPVPASESALNPYYSGCIHLGA